MFWSLDIEYWNLPFDWAQSGESLDFAQDREPVERLVEPFGIWFLVLGIFMIFIDQVSFVNSVKFLFK